MSEPSFDITDINCSAEEQAELKKRYLSKISKLSIAKKTYKPESNDFQSKFNYFKDSIEDLFKKNENFENTINTKQIGTDIINKMRLLISNTNLSKYELSKYNKIVESYAISISNINNSLSDVSIKFNSNNSNILNVNSNNNFSSYFSSSNTNNSNEVEIKDKIDLKFIDFFLYVTEENTNKNLSIDRITNSIIGINNISSNNNTTINSAFISNIHNSIILLPTICKSSIICDNITNSILFIASNQIRIHNSNDCTYYLYSINNPIIEDCDGLFFAPYQISEIDIQKLFFASGITENTNNWNNIQDFNWLDLQTSSPHWSILPQDTRKKFLSEIWN